MADLSRERVRDRLASRREPYRQAPTCAFGEVQILGSLAFADETKSSSTTRYAGKNPRLEDSACRRISRLYWPSLASVDNRRGKGFRTAKNRKPHASMICNKSFMISNRWYGSLGLTSNVKCL